MIRLSEHSFGPGEATTTLHTNWAQEIGSTTNPLGAPKKVSGDGSSPDICIQNENPTVKADLGGSVVDDIAKSALAVADNVGVYFLDALDRFVDMFSRFNNDSVGSSEYPDAGPGQGGTQTGVD